MSIDDQIEVIQNQILSFFNYKRIGIYILLIGLNRFIGAIAFGG